MTSRDGGKVEDADIAERWRMMAAVIGEEVATRSIFAVKVSCFEFLFQGFLFLSN